MKLKEFNFNSIVVRGLSIFVGNEEVVVDFIGDALRKVPHLKDFEIIDTNYYFLH